MEQLLKFREWLSINCSSKNTVEAYYFQMKAFFNFSKEEISQDLINKYFLFIIESKQSTSKFNLARYAFGSWFVFSKTQYELPKKRRSDKRLIENFITEKELEEILNDFPRIFSDSFHAEIILKVLFYVGLRRGELINLKRIDINLEKFRITLRDTKSKRDAVISFPPSLRPSIIAYFSKEREITNAFNVSVGQINNIFNKINEQLKPRIKLHPHCMRHSWAKYALKKTGDIAGVQKQLRHSNINTTMIYAERTQEMQEEWFLKNFK